ncbi:MAG TPA: STAS domain-containing protein [Chthoniobacterales bacterium]
MSLPASILVGVSGKTVHAKVQGKGSFQNSPALKEFTRRMLDRGYRTFVVDLTDCSVMDSTFMGTLAGIALRLREAQSGSLRVRNVNERNYELLRNLGLDNLFQIESAEGHEAVAEPAMLPNQPVVSKADHAECMITAHEALVDADPENLARFKDVLEYLRQDLRVGVGR